MMPCCTVLLKYFKGGAKKMCLETLRATICVAPNGCSPIWQIPFLRTPTYNRGGKGCKSKNFGFQGWPPSHGARLSHKKQPLILPKLYLHKNSRRPLFEKYCCSMYKLRKSFKNKKHQLCQTSIPSDTLAKRSPAWSIQSEYFIVQNFTQHNYNSKDIY